MQRDLVIQQLKEDAKKVGYYLDQVEQDVQFTQTETERFLSDIEKLYRNLSVYSYLIKTQGNLEVHLKIMQTVPQVETYPIIEKKEEPVQLTIEEKVEEIITSVTKEEPVLKRIEFSINDRFRIINELFYQSQQEFQAALQQLNSITTLEETNFYLDSLREIYNWKKDADLVKTIYALAQKRFS